MASCNYTLANSLLFQHSRNSFSHTKVGQNQLLLDKAKFLSPGASKFNSVSRCSFLKISSQNVIAKGSSLPSDSSRDAKKAENISFDQPSASLKSGKSIENSTNVDQLSSTKVIAPKLKSEPGKNEINVSIFKEEELYDISSKIWSTQNASSDSSYPKEVELTEEEKLNAEELKKEAERNARAVAELKAQEEQLKEILEKQQEMIRKMEEEKKQILISKLSLEKEVRGEKMFYIPQTVKAGSEVEVYFHRSASLLKGEKSISIRGAFNDWLWKPFEIDMKPSLDNDWWKGVLFIPEEAYKVDMVFHSSNDLFDNNEKKDFLIPVEGGMSEVEFGRLYAALKRKEDERNAFEEGERKKAEEEERRIAEMMAEENADRAKANEMARSFLSDAENAYKKASRDVYGVWYTKPQDLKPGVTVDLFYNRSYRPLASSQQVWLHAGYNNWVKGVSSVVQLLFNNNIDGDWWSVRFDVPEDAYVLNWVLADGPPSTAIAYDNNNQQDYSAIVGQANQNISSFFKGIEEQYYLRIKAERKEKAEAAAALLARKEKKRKEMKAKTKKAFLQSQAHILYTDPAEPIAGDSVTIFYNPNNTVLNGRPDVFLRGSFNRWTHRNGIFGPIRMQPAENGTHLKATVNVPIDAYVMDFVFSDSANEHGGLYDNRGNLDYHVPVKGGSTKEPSMNIVHIALEMAPIAKVGGLGDVVTSLSRAIQELGHNVEVVLPKYDCLKYNFIHNIEEKEGFDFFGTFIKVWYGTVEGVPVHFLEPQSGQFWVGCIYGRKDDGERFGFFCNIALEFLLRTGRHPDIIHCHDWSSAPAAWVHSENYGQSALGRSRSVFTIHNLEFGIGAIGRAMNACRKATTVSPTYAQEISGHGAISPHLGKFHGIINGIDPDIWDPLADPFIPVPYSSEDVVQGKIAAKRELRQRLGLAQVDRPLVGVITRLTAQKGIHLIKHAIWRTLDRGGQVVLLGSAPDPRVQSDFEALATQLSQTYSNQARLWLTYDEPLSHLIYAACDMILVPSIFEPCGLTQLIAMRYGAIPVVRKTGGLNDTVLDVDNDHDRAKGLGLECNGFSFEGTDAMGLDYALNRAISGWYEGREWWNGLAKTVMEQDWTWNRPALDYIELYYGARKD